MAIVGAMRAISRDFVGKPARRRPSRSSYDMRVDLVIIREGLSESGQLTHGNPTFTPSPWVSVSAPRQFDRSMSPLGRSV
jgi:hypothetical protein